MNTNTTPHIAAIALLACTSFSSLQAGKVNEVYSDYVSADASIESADFLLQASEQHITTKKRGYLPKIAANAKALSVTQDISQEDTTVFDDGRDTYGNNRAKIELDQPLIDLTLKPEVEAAQALHQSRKHQLTIRRSQQTQYMLETFLETAKYYTLDQSYNRVIARLQEELAKVSQSFDEQLTTVEDVENVKSALSAMQHEQRINRDHLQFKLLEIGVTPDTLESGWVVLDANKQFEITSNESESLSPAVGALQAEVTAYEKRITATRRGDLPRLSLYGLYEYDDSEGSEFGGERSLSNYEFGVSLDWNIFDRGITRSESKELYYLKRAKEADLRYIAAQEKRKKEMAKLSAELSEQNVSNLRNMVASQEKIHQAAQRAYEDGGTQSYINVLNSYLIYESQSRQLIASQYTHLLENIRLQGANQGWNKALVNSVDTMFLPSN